MNNRGITQKLLTIFLPRLGEIFFLAIFAAIIGMGPRTMNQDGDLGRHLTLGRYILESRSIPVEDVFSFTKSGDPLTPHEWLADVFFALADRAAGLNGVVWFSAIVLAGSCLLVYHYSYRLSNLRLVSLLIGLMGAAAASVHWLTRPHIFTILFAAFWVGELEKMRLGLRRSWWIFPVSMLFWVNIHGAFIAGLLIWVCFYVGEVFEKGLSWHDNRNLLFAGLSSFLVSLINPDGVGIWRTGFGFLGNRYLVSHTAEYLPPDFQNTAFWPFLLLVFVSILILAYKPRKICAAHSLLIAGWTVMALYSARNIPLYVVAVVPFLCVEFAAILAGWGDHPLVSKLMNLESKVTSAEKLIKGGFWGVALTVLALLMLMSGAVLDAGKEGNQFQADIFPVDAANWMGGNNVTGNGFNHFPWGGYLLYRFWPERLVFIDGQTDFYGEYLTREYEEVISVGSGWEEILEKYDVDWALIPTGSSLAVALSNESDWSLVYNDPTAELFIKD
jgi:hypothetical protein